MILQFSKNINVRYITVLVYFIVSTICSSYVDIARAVNVAPCDPNDPVRIKINEFRAANDILYYDDCVDKCPSPTASTNGTPAGSTLVSNGSGGGCGTNTNNDKANKDQIWGFLNSKFKGKGFSTEESEKASAGIMGNWEQESAFNSYRQDGMGCETYAAFGIAQWCGDRITKLKNYAAENGKDATCLGIQLEFVWSELETMPNNFWDALKNASSAGKAANIFDDGGDGPAKGINGFEESTATDNEKRASNADKQYTEYTGKTTSSTSSNSSSSSCISSRYGGGIPPEDCGILVEQYKSLEASGRITQYLDENKKNIYKDLENCTTNPIECGTGGGKGGVNPRILRAVVAAAENSGAVLEQWNFNTGHDCDGKNHPRGMGTDLKCNGNQITPKGGPIKTATDDCNKLFIYLYDHYDELGLTELIWQYPPPGYSCSDPKIICTVDGHTDHIHIGARV